MFASFGKNKTYFSGGGGLHGTAYDYFRFGQMMLNKGELDGVRLSNPTPGIAVGLQWPTIGKEDGKET